MFSGSALLDVFRSPQVSGANVCELDSADCSSHRDQTISSNPAAMSRQNRDPFRATANRQCVAALRARSPEVGNFVSLHSSSYCLRHMMDINATLFPFPFNVIPCHCRSSTLYLQALYGYNVDTSVDKHPFACLEVDQHQQVDDLPPSPRYLNWSHTCAMQMPAASHKFHPRILIHPSLLFFHCHIQRVAPSAASRVVTVILRSAPCLGLFQCQTRCNPGAVHLKGHVRALFQTQNGVNMLQSPRLSVISNA